jgi:nucleoid DNA-binding protein
MAKEKKPAAKGKAPTKSQVMSELAETAGITRKQVTEVFTALEGLIKKHLKKDGDTFSIPGLIRLRLKRQKAQKGGKEVPDPFNPGKTRITKDKAAKNVIRARALKGLNTLVQ